MSWLAYLPWILPLAILLGYEAWAGLTKRPTLSQLVWRLQKRHVWTRYVIAGLLLWLMAHFYFGGG